MLKIQSSIFIVCSLFLYIEASEKKILKLFLSRHFGSSEMLNSSSQTIRKKLRNKFQPGIQFKTIDQLLDCIPTKELKIVGILRDIILDTLPHCTEKLSYNVPYYSLNKRICFIWPCSIPWGKIKEGVMIGFTYGSQLTDLGYLDKENRKTVFTKTYISPTEIDSKIITSLLLESAIIDKR